ncbi:hypothetical protein P3T27_006204 [Kitasatospora sp. MAA19]|nr:hypothetical protein [Kitasatospora sp. MAA19]
MPIFGSLFAALLVLFRIGIVQLRSSGSADND